jgi:hypothetical protein
LLLQIRLEIPLGYLKLDSLTEAMTPVKRTEVQLTTGECTTILVDAAETFSSFNVADAEFRHQG